MRKLFEAMRMRLEGFLAQRQTLLLVVRAGPAEYLPLLSTVTGIEEGASQDVFWIFTDPFENPNQYAKAIVASFQAQYKALAEELSKSGSSVPADVPPAVLDERRPPADRLRDMFIFARSLIEDLEAAHLVVGFLPSEITNALPYAQLVMALVAHEMPVPWCHHMRIIAREDAGQALLSEHGRALPRTEFYAPDLGQEAVQGALAEEANDASLPLPQRMQSLMLLAGMDLAYRRFPLAKEKYALLATYHKTVGPKPLHALSLHGVGQAYDLAGNKVEAQRHYEKALVPAVDAQDPVSLINITTSLANLHRTQEHWPEAYEYYLGLSGLAKATCSPELQLRSLEQMGYCKYKMHDVRGAWEHWNAGVTLARGVNSREHLLDCLERIRALYKEAGMSAKRNEVEPEIAELKRQGVTVYPA
jgi:tetratricopeptide (TPR) repeat protein